MKLVTILRTFVSQSLSFATAQRSIESADTGSVPRMVKYTGTLTDTSGKAVSQIQVAMFLMYGDAHGGEPIWMEIQNVYPDKNGKYSVVLGATTKGLPESLFASREELWLAIQTAGGLESPRMLLAAVPCPFAASAAGRVTVPRQNSESSPSKLPYRWSSAHMG